MRVLFSISLLALAGCVSTGPVFMTSAPVGSLVAEIRLTQSAFSGPPKGDTGFFFYLQNEPGIAGPCLTGCRYENGVLVDVFGGGWASAEVVRALESIDLEPFDFDEEVKVCEARIQADARQRGEQIVGPMVFDGWEYEIVFVTRHGRFALKKWNPGPTIDYCAPHSDKIAKLKAVIDLLARFYGRHEFGI